LTSGWAIVPASPPTGSKASSTSSMTSNGTVKFRSCP
jgi:hypothetical protein